MSLGCHLALLENKREVCLHCWGPVLQTPSFGLPQTFVPRKL